MVQRFIGSVTKIPAHFVEADRLVLHQLVMNINLDYTIIQPSVIKEEKGTGKIEINPVHDGSNPIPDAAKVLSSVPDTSFHRADRDI